MLTLQNGTLTLRKGRLTVDSLMIQQVATVLNDSEIYTTTTLSEGSILGSGTLWAHVSSKPISGSIASLHTVIYYGEQFITRRYIQIMSGSYSISSPSGDGSIIS